MYGSYLATHNVDWGQEQLVSASYLLGTHVMTNAFFNGDLHKRRQLLLVNYAIIFKLISCDIIFN